MKSTMLLLMAALLMGTMAASAIPVRPGQWATLKLADGTTVRAELRGSEYGTWYQDAQGQCYVRQGDCYVRSAEAKTEAGYRSARKSRAGRRALYTSTANGLGAKGSNSAGSMYSVGEHTIPVLMVEFTDAIFNPLHTPEFIQDYLTKEGFQYVNPNTGKTQGVGSIRDFFVAQSKGMFKPNFKVLGKVTLDKSYKYYGQHGKNAEGEEQTDLHPDEMVFEAMQAAMKQLEGVDFKQYVMQEPIDNNHKKGIPLLCCLYAGEAESNHGNKDDPENYQPDLLWPQEQDIDADVKVTENTTVHLNSFFIGNELAIDGKSLAGIGVFVHELGHALGLPDWYCTTDDPNLTYSGDDAFGLWSTMDVGCYVGSLWTPMGYTAYERSYMGWCNIPTIKESGHVKLSKPYDENDCAVFFIKGDHEKDTEYFIVETRYPSTWYPAAIVQPGEKKESFGSGLMLSRFAFDKKDWNGDSPNNVKDAKRGMIITADGEHLNHAAHQSNLFGNGVNTISGQKFYSGETWGATLKNIKKNTDGSIEFDLDLGSATGITSIDNSLLTTDDYYDLQGRRISQPTHGIYIHNGKKVVIQ